MVDEDEDDDGSGSKRRMTDEEFATAKELYELGKAGLVELAAEFNISRQALSRRFRDANIIKGSRAHELSGAAAQAQKAIVERFSEKRAELIEETRMNGLQALKQARMIGQRMVVEAVKAKKDLGDIDADLRALGRFNKMLVDNLNSALGILQADEHVDEDDLPILTIEDLTDQDVLEHFKDTGVLDKDATLDDLNRMENP